MATVTESNLSYEGSLTLDREILRKAGILPYEQIMVSNLNNGERFVTYVIPREQIPELWQEFLPDLQQYKQAFEQDVWQPRQSGLCSGWCPVHDCEYWRPKGNSRRR